MLFELVKKEQSGEKAAKAAGGSSGKAKSKQAAANAKAKAKAAKSKAGSRKGSGQDVDNSVRKKPPKKQTSLSLFKSMYEDGGEEGASGGSALQVRVPLLLLLSLLLLLPPRATPRATLLTATRSPTLLPLQSFFGRGSSFNTSNNKEGKLGQQQRNKGFFQFSMGTDVKVRAVGGGAALNPQPCAHSPPPSPSSLQPNMAVMLTSSQTGRVHLTAQSAYTMSESELETLVTAEPPTHSRFESFEKFKGKLEQRDALICALQEGMAMLSDETLKFQFACEEIEASFSVELGDLKTHLGQALNSFQQLQKSNEHRNETMKKSLRENIDRSTKVRVALCRGVWAVAVVRGTVAAASSFCRSRRQILPRSGPVVRPPPSPSLTSQPSRPKPTSAP